MIIKAEVGDLMRRNRDDQTQVGYLVAGRSGDRLTSCAIRIVHMEETRNASFLV
jgi:hypothetical protein